LRFAERSPLWMEKELLRSAPRETSKRWKAARSATNEGQTHLCALESPPPGRTGMTEMLRLRPAAEEQAEDDSAILSRNESRQRPRHRGQFLRARPRA